MSKQAYVFLEPGDVIIATDEAFSRGSWFPASEAFVGEKYEDWMSLARRTVSDAQAECAHKFVPYYEGVQLCEKCKATQAECGKSSGEIRSPAWRANVAEVARKAGFQPDAVSGALICTPAVIENFAADIAALSAAPQHSADIDAMQDAARYRWLKAHAATGSIGFGGWWIDAGNMSDELDAAIDAALQAKGVAE
jgi:hypothetical protein